MALPIGDAIRKRLAERFRERAVRAERTPTRDGARKILQWNAVPWSHPPRRRIHEAGLTRPRARCLGLLATDGAPLRAEEARGDAPCACLVRRRFDLPDAGLTAR